MNFVDYGNSATVKKDNVWAVNQDHCTIPVQAICCKLYDISPIEENTAWTQVEGMDKYFEGDNYSWIFAECIDEGSSKSWSVHLINAEGANVGDLLVENGLAVRKNVLKSKLCSIIKILSLIFSGQRFKFLYFFYFIILR